MQKRKPFFIKDNFHLGVIICFVLVLVAGISFATFLVYGDAADIIEEAAFSSHLSIKTSGELFKKAILDANMLTAGIIFVAGLMLIAALHFYLEFFFHSIVKGLERFARADFSFRFKVKGKFWGSQLLKDSNNAADALQKRAQDATQLLDSAIHTVDVAQKEKLWDLHAIHNKLRNIKCP